MAKRTNRTATGKRTTVAGGVRSGAISQTGIRKELAAQRRAFGAEGQKRAMKKWGLREAKPTKRGGKTTIAAPKNG